MNDYLYNRIRGRSEEDVLKIVLDSLRTDPDYSTSKLIETLERYYCDRDSFIPCDKWGIEDYDESP